MTYDFKGLGYRRDLENIGQLRAGAQLQESFYCGDIDPKSLGEPIGLHHILRRNNQGLMNSCTGNAYTTIAEGCIWHKTQGQQFIELSRMFAYVQGQQFGARPIHGDIGANLINILGAAKEVGVCRELLAPYTGFYYSEFSQEAKNDAKKYRLGSYIPITHVDQLYEGLAKRIGGAFFGMNWTGQFQEPFTGGFVDEYHQNDVDWTDQVSGGFHAVCFMDWSSYRDDKGYPRLEMFNSHGPAYGDNGIAHWSRAAVQSALEQSSTVAFFLSDMKFIQPRFDYARQEWTSV